MARKGVIVEQCAEITCSSPLVFCRSFSFSSQRSTAVPTLGPRALSNREFSSISSIDLLFFYQLFIHSRALQLFVFRKLQAADKKIFLRNLMCFRGGLANARLKRANPRTGSYTSPIHPPWIYAFQVFRPCLYEVFVDRLFFFVSPL